MDAGNTQKYHDIIIAAHELFWKHGVKRITIEEVCKEARVSKMTFYKYFPNKIALAKTIVKKIFDESIQEFRAVMEENIIFEEKIKKALLYKFEVTKEISPEFVKDVFAYNNLGLKNYWEERSKDFYNEVLASYKHAQKMGWIRKDINLEFFWLFNMKISEMISDPQFNSLYNNPQELIMEIANLFIYGIFPRNKKNSE